MKIVHIKVENFAGISAFETDLSNRTYFEGPNRCGKSTIRNAIYWCLTDKLSDGSNADGIRPHDDDGKDIDYVEIVVELTIEANEQVYAIKKTQRQKWTRKRNTDEQVFNGNENLFEINGIPKKQKDFTIFIESIVDPDTLLFGMNPMAFLALDTKKRRAKLLAMEDDFTDEDVIATNPAYEELRKLLVVGTVDEQLSRSRRVIKEKKIEQTQIPARIDELAKQRPSVDADIEEKRDSYEAELSEVQKMIDQANEDMRRHAELKEKRYQATLALNKAVREANSAANARKEELMEAQNRTEIKKSGIEHQIQLFQSKISYLESRLSATKSRRVNELKGKYAAVSAETFDESEWIYNSDAETCPTCGRKFDASQVEKIKARFAERKAQAEKAFVDSVAVKKQEIVAEATKCKNEEDDLAREIDEIKQEIETLNESLEAVEAKLKDICDSLDNLPPVDENPDNDACVAARTQISEIDAELGRIETHDMMPLSEKKTHLEHLIRTIDVNLSMSEAIDRRIADLVQKQREVAQAIANEERLMELLQSFDRARVTLLTERVNRHFRIVKFRMFKPLINGGWDSVCEPMVGGSSYFGLLNHGDRILAEMDICMAFQDVVGAKLPIIVDDAESVDSWRIPQIS